MSTIRELLHTLQVQFDEISTRNVQLVKNICSLEDRLKCSDDEVTELRKQERVWMKRCDRLGAMLPPTPIPQNHRLLCDKMSEVVARWLHYFDVMDQPVPFCTVEQAADITGKWQRRYTTDAHFRIKVDSICESLSELIKQEPTENPCSEDELRRLKTVMSEVLEDVCGAKLCSINSMSSRGEMMRLLERATANLRKELE